MRISTWALVPVKPFVRAKSRLAQVLPAQRRRQLAAQLLERTVRLLVAQPGIDGVAVVSRDPAALALAGALGAQTVVETGAPELNAALTMATRRIAAQGAEACLVVPADIPLLSGEDLAQVLTLGQADVAVVLVPDRHGAGTNLLYVRPPGLIAYAFGESSFVAHQRAARDAHAAVAIYRSECAQLDLDTREDLDAYLTQASLLQVEPLTAIALSGSGPALEPHTGLQSV